MYPLAIEKRHVWFAGELAYWQQRAGVLGDPLDWIAEPYRLQLGGAAVGGRSLARAPLPGRGGTRPGGARCRRAPARGTDRARAPRVGAGRQGRTSGAPGARRLGPPGAATDHPVEPGALTTRELDVLRLVATGMRNAEIADELVVSPRTVEHHVASILRKLGVRTRSEAAVAAVSRGLVSGS